MTSKNYKPAQILLTRHQIGWLHQISYFTAKSISQIVRDLIEKERNKTKTEKEKKAFDKMLEGVKF